MSTQTATHRFETQELAALLHAARKHNVGAGLTGMLLHTEQVLEGIPEDVETLCGRIERDRRHQHVTKISSEAIPNRSFEHWTIGFSRVSRKELAAISGSNDFFLQSTVSFAYIPAARRNCSPHFVRASGAKHSLDRGRPLHEYSIANTPQAASRTQRSASPSVAPDVGLQASGNIGCGKIRPQQFREFADGNGSLEIIALSLSAILPL